MTTRAKFYVLSKTIFAGQGGVKVTMQPVYSNDPESENKKFWEATPTGTIELGIKSEAGAEFEPGAEYYIDFTRVS